MMKPLDIAIVCCVLLMVLVTHGRGDEDDEDEDPYTTTDPKKREPSPCEVCKMFATELQSRLDESAKSKAMIETGHGLERKKKFPYKFSETRLTEALHEPHICEKILEYNVHAERKGSLRYAKGMSETMSTLHGLVDKGVKVELGIPYDMWDMPSAEVTKMQRQCFRLAEQYEEDIEDWYYNLQDEVKVVRYLCAERYLRDRDQTCLGEVFVPKGTSDKGDEDDSDEEKKKKKKKKRKNASRKGDLGGSEGDVPEPPPVEPPSADDKDEL